jgi:phosphoribosyl 1,2-cyclic phosphodiesterase
VAPLGSGSRGNATYVGDGKTGVLIDCGLSTRQIVQRMARIGLADAPINAVLITHEHSDHVASSAILERQMRRHHGVGPAFYMTAGTAAGVPQRCMPENVELIDAGTAFTVGGLRIEPLSVPHDTRDPVSFTVASGSTRVGVLTDIGCPTRLLVRQLASLDVAVLEFNHDVEMLIEGDYPWQLKQRIRGHHGHMSNAQSAKLLYQATTLSRRLRHVMLAHLSEENNTPVKAVAACEEALSRAGRLDVEVRICEQDNPLPPAILTRPMTFDTPRPASPLVPARLRRRERAPETEPEPLRQVSMFPRKG